MPAALPRLYTLNKLNSGHSAERHYEHRAREQSMGFTTSTLGS